MEFLRRYHGGRWTKISVCVGLVLLTWLVFGRTVRYDFVNFDDESYVYQNSEVTKGLTMEGAIWAFTHIVSHNWHPLTMLSHMLDCQLFGLRPGWHHFTNVLLHCGAVILLFLLLSEMTGTLWRSGFVTAIFAIHPLRAESVAWISQRKDVLSAVFFMLTVAAYLRYVGRPSLGRYLGMFVLFACGLMSKPMLVTLPFVLLLLDYWPLKRSPRSEITQKGQAADAGGQKWLPLIVEKLPLLALSAAGCVATLLAQRKGINPIDKLSLLPRIGNACLSSLIYVYELFWPGRLAVFYPHPGNNVPLWQVAASIGLLVMITMGVIALRRKYPYLLVGWLWYAVMLLPVIGLIQVGIQAHADRYTYLPQIGLCLAFTWATADLSRYWPPSRIIVAVAAALVILALTWRAQIQTSFWQNSETLWSHAVAVTSYNDTARNARWDALLEENQAEQIITQAEVVIRDNPNDADAYNGLGMAYLQKGRLNDAIVNFEKVLELSPVRPRIHYNIATALLRQGKVNEAIEHFQKELQIQPDFADAHNNLGTALGQAGQTDEAIAHFKRALELSPERPKTHYNLAMMHLQKGNIDDAITEFRQELQIQPSFADAHSDLGVALSQTGRVSAAIAEWQKAVELEPSNLNAECNLAWVLATYPETSIRNGGWAVELAEHAVQLSGSKNPRILRVLAAAYAESGRFREAIRTAEEALQISTQEDNSALAHVLEMNLAQFRTNLPLRDRAGR